MIEHELLVVAVLLIDCFWYALCWCAFLFIALSARENGRPVVTPDTRSFDV